MVVPEADGPGLPGNPPWAPPAHLPIDQAHPFLMPAVDVGAGVDGVVKDPIQLGRAGRPPAQRAGAHIARRQGQAVAREVAGHPIGAAVQAEALEEQADRALHLFVGVEAKAQGVRIPFVPGGGQPGELAAPRLVALGPVQPQPHPVQLRLAHRALEAEQQPIVEVPRRVHALLVDQHDIRERAELQQAVPVGRGPGQPRDFEAEDGPHPGMRHVLGQPLEPEPPLGARAALPQIFVDDRHTLSRPPQDHRPVA